MFQGLLWLFLLKKPTELFEAITVPESHESGNEIVESGILIAGLDDMKSKNDTFRNNVGLEWLFLGGNLIQSLDAAHFVSLKALVLLDLSNNKIMAIQNQTFGKLENLVTLNLTKNSLTSVNSGMFMGCNKLSELIIDRSALNEVITFAYGRKNKQNVKEKSFFAYSI